MRTALLRIGRALAGLSLAGLAMVGLGAGRWYMELAAYAVPLYAIFSAVALLIAVWYRRRALALLASVLVLSTFGQLWQVSRPRPAPPRFLEATERIRILTANLFVHNDDAERLLAFIDKTRPDVIVLQEYDEAWQERLRDLRDVYEGHFACPRSLRGSTDLGIYWRLPKGTARSLSRDGLPGSLLELEIAGRRIAVLNLHTAAPFTEGRAKRHAEEMRALAQWIALEKRPLIVAGDLNSTPWTPLFQETVGELDLRSARTGAGVMGTWPAYLGPLATPLDHILVREGVLRLDGCWLGPYFGSDHLPLLADVELVAAPVGGLFAEASRSPAERLP